MIRAILIDDEPLPLETLKHLVQRFCPDVNVLHALTDPSAAVEAILEHQPDLLLLDIEMPKLSGFEVLERIRDLAPRPQVIFITAHNEYAVRAFDFALVHYLLKPVEAAALVSAVARARENIRLERRSFELDLLLDNHRHASKEPPILALPIQNGLYLAKLADIVYLEAKGAYTIFHFNNKDPQWASHHLGHYEGLLKDHHFVRIHDSHIVSLMYVQSYINGEGGQVCLLDGTHLTVSRRRKENLLKKINKGGK